MYTTLIFKHLPERQAEQLLIEYANITGLSDKADAVIEYADVYSNDEVIIDDTFLDELMGIEPECSASDEEREELGIECEYEQRDGEWWCITHNCEA